MIGGLVRTSHPGPGLAVTLLATALAAGDGASALRCLLVLLVVGVGQLSIGWANDWLDAGRDRAVGRTDKPVASGAVPEHVVRAAALASAALSVPLSFALGTGAGAAHLVVVASGWAYDLGLKRTVLSWVPYATAFGTLPAVVRLGVPPGEVPPSWLVVAGALLGVGAHVVNTLPDLDDDRATGVFSAPYRLGRKGSGVAAPLLLVLASALVVSGTGGGALGVVGLVVSAALAVVAVLAALRGVRGQLTVLAAAGIALVDVVLVVASGSALTG
ncbi:UbiA family prenyltransferase [Angustibacter aerolatus]